MHPILVATEGVNLAVMAEHAARLGAIPCKIKVFSRLRLESNDISHLMLMFFAGFAMPHCVGGCAHNYQIQNSSITAMF